eukprot:6484059-Amphidinium_carterae.1
MPRTRRKVQPGTPPHLGVVACHAKGSVGVPWCGDASSFGQLFHEKLQIWPKYNIRDVNVARRDVRLAKGALACGHWSQRRCNRPYLQQWMTKSGLLDVSKFVPSTSWVAIVYCET